MKNWLKYSILTLAVFGLIAALFYTALRLSPALQDRVVARALNQIMSAQMQTNAFYGGDNLDVVFCGTASPMGGGDRAQQCIAVLAGDHFFIVDSGARSTTKAVAAGLPLGRLDGVLLTHFHSDHISSLGELQLQSWAQGRPSQLTVYGGPGVAQVVDGFNLAYGLDYGYRTAHHGEDIMPSQNAGLKAQSFTVSDEGLIEIYNDGGLVISAFKVPHDPVRPALGYRFDYRGRSVVISGDTSKSEAVVEAAQETDVLIHEVLQPHLVNETSRALEQVGRLKLGQLIRDTLDYHTSPIDAAEVANRANAELLVFTHLAPNPANGLIETIFMRGVDLVRTAPTVIAQDGMFIRLPIGGDDIQVQR
jgi:ribonuclease Z